MERNGSDPPRPGAIIRSLLLATTIFAVAMSTGALLAGAAAAGSELTPAATETAAEQTNSALDPMLGPSLIYTGTAALAVSVVGLVMVARRRRLW